MSYLLLYDHYGNLEEEENKDKIMPYTTPGDEWEEDRRKGRNPSRDIRDRKKDEPDSKDERKCSKSETDKSE